MPEPLPDSRVHAPLTTFPLFPSSRAGVDHLGRLSLCERMHLAQFPDDLGFRVGPGERVPGPIRVICAHRLSIELPSSMRMLPISI